MKNINEYLYGPDYASKSEKFRKAVNEIHNSYEGGFDINTPYFTTEPHQTKGEIRLTFDQDKEIPTELKQEIERAFDEIWK